MSLSGSIDMWLNRDEDSGSWLLINARISHERHSQRILFDTPMTLDMALHPLVAQCLRGALARQYETAVLSDRGLTLDLGTLRLDGLRILTRVAPDGASTASVRFLASKGDCDAILSEGIRPAKATAPAPPAVDTLVAPVLQDLLCPALEVFDHILQNGLSDDNARALAARVKTMRAKRDELSDYIALLSGIVAGEASADGRGAPTREISASVRPDQRLASRGLRWSSTTGLSRGHDCGILHGHNAALELKG